MNRRQRTIGRPVSLSGVGLFAGREATLRLEPAGENAGVVFRRVDLAGRPEVRALAEFAVGEEARTTTLRSGDACVRMVEHVLSAAHGLGVDNLTVEMDGEETPAGDGSALCYVELLRSAGIVEQDAERPALRVDRPLFASHGAASVAIAPWDGGLRVTYTMDYGRPVPSARTVTVDITEETYAERIAPARTYVLRGEIAGFQRRGLGKGASPDTVLIVEDDGTIRRERRFEDELARHKIVDLLGDLFLAGVSLQGHVKAYRSGHALNLSLARLAACAAGAGGGAAGR
ncbi:MAG TPA: UDP-3-O-acyl-N-acetylglucosamine deacetylase [Candidatus Brocadiia bacterium]|nr:UDP-3-O-acyl-N-acetylglucosamine deacetylase [Candidatus Brocadiia bacterium]